MPTLANEPAEDRMTGAYPDESGYFGRYGGAFIAETLMGPVKEPKMSSAGPRTCTA